MKPRVITGIGIAVVYIGTALLSTYVHSAFFDAFILIMMLLGAYEITNAFKRKYSTPLVVPIFATIVLGYTSFLLCQYLLKATPYASIGFSVYLAILVLVILGVFIVCKTSKTLVTGNAVTTTAALIYPTTLLMYSVAFNYLPELYRCTAIMLFFAIPPFTDCMAFFVGSTLKGKKLCPSVSPNKTISGAIGGLFGGILGALLVMLFAYLSVTFGINIMGAGMLADSWGITALHFVLMGLIGSVFDQFGDLFASFIKRRVDLKDFSHILPGHGGILDRIDGMVFTGVFIYIYCTVLLII